MSLSDQDVSKDKLMKFDKERLIKLIWVYKGTCQRYSNILIKNKTEIRYLYRKIDMLEDRLKRLREFRL